MERKYQILKSIISLFIKTATPVGSKTLKELANIPLSSSTLRNEMSKLEKEGFLMQSHISGGRIPTTKGYRFFVNDLDLSSVKKESVQNEFKKTAIEYFREKQVDQNIYDIVSILSKLTPNIVFATIPSAKKMFFLGISHLVTQTDFSSGNDISGIFKVLEEDLYSFLESLNLQKDIELFIGDENLLTGIDSCSLLVSKEEIFNKNIYFGILGPIRMDYIKNIIALQESKKILEDII
jgi:transcriptional regulator of heat shock response